MGQVWYYDAFLPSEVTLSVDKMDAINNLLERSGFSPINPVTGDIEVFRLNPLDLEMVTLKFKSWGDLLAASKIAGNRLVIWKGDVDAYLEFNLEGATTDAYKEIVPRNISRYGSLSLSIDNTHYHADEMNGKATADAVRKIFLGLCDYFVCTYGLSYNEEMIETIQRVPNRFPAVMFWLNYFSYEFLRNIDIKKIKQIGGKFRQTRNGGIVEFASYPWERSQESLVDTNEQWLLIK